MTNEDLSNTINKLGTTKTELEQLLNYSKNYLTSFAKKPIPKHIVLMLKFLEILHDSNIDFKAELRKMDLSKNPHKGGKFEKKH